MVGLTVAFIFVNNEIQTYVLVVYLVSEAALGFGGVGVGVGVGSEIEGDCRAEMRALRAVCWVSFGYWIFQSHEWEMVKC